MNGKEIERRIVNNKEVIGFKTKCSKCGSRYFTTNIASRRCPACLERSELKKLGIQGGLLALRFKVFRRDRFKCVVCGRMAKTGTILNIEHLHPLSKGGTWAIDNLVTMCFECNQGKKTMILLNQPTKKACPNEPYDSSDEAF